MQVERRTIESNLLSKGFIKRESDHTYLHYRYQGKPTGIYTRISRGSGYKTYGINLLKVMKTQLKLESIQQVVDLCRCPISRDDYNQILRDKGFL